MLAIVVGRVAPLNCVEDTIMGQNYFNTRPLRVQLEELGKCRFMDRSEFADGCDYLKGKKIVIVGCGAQGLNQGMNLRDSGLTCLTHYVPPLSKSSASLGKTLPKTALP